MTNQKVVPGDRANALAAQLAGIPKDKDGPVFREPWEARAFAITVTMHERGVFTWSEWAESLSAAIKRSEAESGVDNGERYYEHWLAALEDIVTRKQVCTTSLLDKRREDWRESARLTPHGQAIELRIG
ncbi:nitrile hydratase accessory protein [Achromobacter denitrificans]